MDFIHSGSLKCDRLLQALFWQAVGRTTLGLLPVSPLNQQLPLSGSPLR